MGKIAINLLKYIFYFAFVFLFIIWYSIKHIIKGKLPVKIVLLGIYIGVAVTYLYAPVIFFITVIAFVSLSAVFAFYIMKDSGSEKNSNNESDESNESNKYKRTNRTTNNPFFEGMTLEEAKKEYRKLMKIYHPDNKNGSLEMTQKIAEAYSNFCSSCGR